MAARDRKHWYFLDVKVRGGDKHRVVVTSRGAVACLDHPTGFVKRFLVLAEFGDAATCSRIVSYQKRGRKVATTGKLTADQAAAWDMVIDFVNDEKPALPEIALLGFAGTGKTYLVRRLLEYLAEKGLRVACVAPTNKAVQVLKSGQEAFGVRFCTLHSFLGLRPRIDVRTGAEVYAPDPLRPPGEADLLVIDEASMVGEALYELTHRTRRPETRLLWVGDPAQLPPVREADSQALSCPTQYVLREVVRFGDAIGRYVASVREAVEGDLLEVPRPADCHEDGRGVYVLPRKEWMARLIEDFRSKEFEEDTNFVRALAWRNNLVDWGNRVIHQQLHGADALPFVPGQVLVAKTPVLVPGESQIAMATSDECRVLKAGRCLYAGFACWRLDVELIGGDRQTFYAVDPGHAGGLAVKIEDLKAAALQETDPDRRGRRWREYYSYRETFADLALAYWSTVHKAQGSTFERAYVAGGDVLENPDRRERHRMLYTAYTRASKQLVITE